ncbi:DUF3769 domain-containing protein [Neosynechococcus sphagnicola]|uniref:DUF3769 domain-containing protein n=1 Tax=Neosynechococcus sphagnicola TaxID=1501145 RepID=UPI00068A7298|nr:DUF3769 domain-containing protein [Neosynechococcus sphagnicola]
MLRLTQNSRTLRGERVEYNFVQGTGVVIRARGEVFLRSAQRLLPTLPTDVTAAGVSAAPISDRITASQPISRVTSPDRLSIVTGFGQTSNLQGFSGTQSFIPQAGGMVNRLRFEADRVDFNPQGWEATNVRITNDPFSPPEFEIRSTRARLRPISPFEDELTTRRAQMVFDQRVKIPLPFRRMVFDRRRNNPGFGLVEFGYDATERGGLFIQRTFTPFSNDRVKWTIIPQFFVQEAFASESFQQNLGVTINNPPPRAFLTLISMG